MWQGRENRTKNRDKVRDKKRSDIICGIGHASHWKDSIERRRSMERGRERRREERKGEERKEEEGEDGNRSLSHSLFHSICGLSLSSSVVREEWKWWDLTSNVYLMSRKWLLCLSISISLKGGDSVFLSRLPPSIPSSSSTVPAVFHWEIRREYRGTTIAKWEGCLSVT